MKKKTLRVSAEWVSSTGATWATFSEQKRFPVVHLQLNSSTCTNHQAYGVFYPLIIWGLPPPFFCDQSIIKNIFCKYSRDLFTFAKVSEPLNTLSNLIFLSTIKIASNVYSRHQGNESFRSQRAAVCLKTLKK